MKLKTVICFIVLTMLAGALAGGCASGAKPSAADRTGDTVVLSNAHGRVATYALVGGTPTASMEAGAKTCAECDSAAAGYYKTGKIEPTCKTCGAKRTIVRGRHGG